MNTVLQHIKTDFKGDRHALYAEQNTNAVSYSGYFNCFYEQQTRIISEITQVTFSAQCKGKGGISIIRRILDGSEHVLFHYDHNEHDEIHELHHEVPLRDGRLYIKTEGEIEIKNAVWATSQTPVREVSLAIVVCTFRKEQHISKAVEELLSSAAMSMIPWQLFIVDNASELQGSIFSNNKITLIQQSNVGGAGGFTRGIIEAHQHKFSHVLLMDDDIELDTESIFRTRQLFLYAKEITCLGGPMLDLIKPTEMWESSAYYDSHTCFRVHSKHHKFNLTSQGNLDQLLSNNMIEPLGYCGWWYFSFPLTAVEKCGLPLPCFIRGDDKEYGIRFTSQGINSISLMGTGVWHEPFYVKHAAWLWYFDVYNSLLIAALYEPWTVSNLINSFHKVVARYIKKLDYENAALRIYALEDFILGSKYFTETSAHDRFMRCKSISKQFEPSRKEKNTASPHDRKPSFILSILISIFEKCLPPHRSKIIIGILGLRKKQFHTSHKQHSWRMSYIADEIIVHDEYADYDLCYRFDSQVEQQLHKQLSKCLANLDEQWSQLCNDFQAKRAYFISLEYWQKYIKNGF